MAHEDFYFNQAECLNVDSRNTAFESPSVEETEMDESRNKGVMRMIGKLARLRISGIAIGKLEQLAAKVGVDEKELFQLYVKTKNKASRSRFASTPYKRRILLLPQCLRSRDCPAELQEYGYECQHCGKCRIEEVIQEAKRLGYQDVFILPGGSMAKNILTKEKPNACLGVACLKELMLGSFICEKFGVAGQGIALLRDGCVNTDVDWNILNDHMHLNSNIR